MNKEKTIYMHKLLWNWLAEHPDKEKEHWPDWKGLMPVQNNCFLCDYAMQVNPDTDLTYGCCVLDWEAPGRCYKESSYYSLYEVTENLKERSWLASKIANLREAKEGDS